MPAIHLRDLDDAVLAALKARAAANHRSLTGEVKAILTEAVMGASTRGSADAPPRRRRLELHVVRVGSAATFSRDELYDDGGH